MYVDYLHIVTNMNDLPRYLHFEIIKFINARWFVNYVSVNKKTMNNAKIYLKYIKNVYEKENICKTYKNCLYKLQDSNKYGFEDENQKISKNVIIKIVSIQQKNKGDKYKIIYWVLCKMKKVGNLPVSYPDWAKVKTIDKDKFIPFY